MNEIDRLKEKIAKLESEKKESVEELERRLKVEKEKKEKRCETLYNKLMNQLDALKSEYDENSYLYEEYFDDWEDAGPKLIRDLTEDKTSDVISYEYSFRIDAEIKTMESRARASAGYVEALKRFKEYVESEVKKK